MLISTGLLECLNSHTQVSCVVVLVLYLLFCFWVWCTLQSPILASLFFYMLFLTFIIKITFQAQFVHLKNDIIKRLSPCEKLMSNTDYPIFLLIPRLMVRTALDW